MTSHFHLLRSGAWLTLIYVSYCSRNERDASRTTSAIEMTIGCSFNCRRKSEASNRSWMTSMSEIFENTSLTNACNSSGGEMIAGLAVNSG